MSDVQQCPDGLSTRKHAGSEHATCQAAVMTSLHTHAMPACFTRVGKMLTAIGSFACCILAQVLRSCHNSDALLRQCSHNSGCLTTFSIVEQQLLVLFIAV